MQKNVRQLGDWSGNSVKCEVHEDTYELTWPDGTSLQGKSPRPWDTILGVLNQPHHSLVRQAIDTLRTTKSAS